MIDCQLFGVNARSHHIMNVLLHAVNALLLFTLLRRIFGDVWKSAFIVAVFAIHPLRVESVAWIAERKDVLAALFYILTIMAYVRYVKRPKVSSYLVAILIFAIGLMAKPMLVTLPLVLLLLDCWPLQRTSLIRCDFQAAEDTERAKPLKLIYLILEKIPFLILSVILVGLWKFSTQNLGIDVTANAVPVKLRVANAIVSYLSYIGMIFWPSDLGAFYPYPDSVAPLKAVSALVVLIAITTIAIKYIRTKPYIALGWFWYLITLGPVIGLVQAGTWPEVADRFSYLPSIGITIIIAFAAQQAFAKLKHRAIVLTVLTSIILIALGLSTHRYINYWKDELSLFKRTLDVTEGNYITHSNYGYALNLAGQKDMALKHFELSLEIKPNYTSAMNNMASILKDKGKTDRAVELWQKIVTLDPKHSAALSNMGLTMVSQGKPKEAIEYFKRSIAGKPDGKTHFALAFLYAQSGENDLAIENYKKAIELQPDYQMAYFYLAASTLR